MTDWRIVGKNTYIDIDSIVQVKNNIYECWILETNNGNGVITLKNNYNVDIDYSITQSLINILTKEALIKSVLIYNRNGDLITNLEDIMKNQSEWFDIPPGCVADVAYNIILGKYMPPKQQRVGCLGIIFLIIIVLIMINL